MNTKETKTVTITFEEYRRLLDSDLFAYCLEQAGVCDWEHYEDALHDGGYYDDEDRDDDDIEIDGLYEDRLTYDRD